MIILDKYKLLQKLVGLNPLGGIENILLRILYLVTLISFNSSELIFIILNIHDGIDRAVPPLASLLGIIPAMSSYVYLLINREKYYFLLQEMQDIVNERAKKEENEIIYARAEQRMTFATKMTIFGLVLAPMMSLSPFVLAAYHWFAGKYSIDSWFFYTPLWTPFEMNTTARCAIIVLFVTTVAAGIMTVYFMEITLLIGFMIYMEACLLDLKSLFDQMDRLSKLKNPELLLLERCKEAVELHGRLNRFLNELAEMMNTVLLLTITPWTMCICSTLLIIEQYSGNAFLYDLQMAFLTSSFLVLLLFILFNLGQKFHTNLMDFGDTIYQSEWHRYPRSVRRFVQFMIMRSQRPFYLSAHGIMIIKLERFIALMKWIYSAFMLLINLE